MMAEENTLSTNRPIEDMEHLNVYDGFHKALRAHTLLMFLPNVFADLSFNKIENIGGLDSLRKLELLNLAFNNISVIKNMDTLENLTHFFISKNQIEDKECVHYLMRFKKLFKLSIGGNPFTEKDDQSLYVAAFIPNVILLDNILITPQMVSLYSCASFWICLFSTSVLHNEASETISDTENQMDTQVNDSKEALIKEVNNFVVNTQVYVKLKRQLIRNHHLYALLQIQEEEERRNRVRISDIYRYYEFLLKPVEEME
uniref:Dynein regulatory complex subunit 3 n=1 Tax=Poecilia latipinna TaxID=48699 RepID=A0A3B3UJI8_9TELE